MVFSATAIMWLVKVSRAMDGRVCSRGLSAVRSRKRALSISQRGKGRIVAVRGGKTPSAGTRRVLGRRRNFLIHSNLDNSINPFTLKSCSNQFYWKNGIIRGYLGNLAFSREIFRNRSSSIQSRCSVRTTIRTVSYHHNPNNPNHVADRVLEYERRMRKCVQLVYQTRVYDEYTTFWAGFRIRDRELKTSDCKVYYISGLIVATI